MKTLVPLSLATLLITLGPSLANADSLNWAVWPGSKPQVAAVAPNQPAQPDRPADVLVEAGLDDSPLAPVVDQQDLFDSDRVVAAEVDHAVADAGAPEQPVLMSDSETSEHDVSGTDVSGTDVSGTDVSGTDVSVTDVSGTDVGGTYVSVPEPDIAANTSTVLPEFESSGEVIEEMALQAEVAAEIPTKSIDSEMLADTLPVTVDTPDALDTNTSTDEAAAIIEPAPMIATDLPFAAEAPVAAEDGTSQAVLMSDSETSEHDVSGTDVSATDVSATDVSATDVSATDVSATDVSATDVSGTDVSVPEPDMAANTSTVLPEFESSGEVIEEMALQAEVAAEIPTKSIDSEMLADTLPVTVDTPDALDTNTSTDEAAAIIEPAPMIATDLPFVAEAPVAAEDGTETSEERSSAADTSAIEDVMTFSDKALATVESTVAEVYNSPIIEPVVEITPTQRDTPVDAIEARPPEALAETSSEAAPWVSEGNEDSNLAALEAEVNDTLILGPVAIADDLADAAQGTEANTERASQTLSSPEANTPVEPVGRYDEVMSEIIKADAIVDAEQPIDTGEVAPLPLEEVLELALANNPEVAMALAREEQARWGAREAAAYRSPTVDLSAEIGPERNRPATRTSDIDDITPGRNINLRISKLLYDGGVSVAEEDRRRQIRRSTEIETRLVIEGIVLSAVESYMAILQNQQAARVAEEFVAEMQRMVNQISQMHQSGAASKIELDFAKSRLASARAQTGNSAAQLNDALSDLEFLTGDLPPFKAVAPINVSTVAVDTLINYVETARSNNAEILLNDSTKTTLALKIRGQQAAYKPIVTLNFKSEGLQDEGGNSDPRSTTELKLKAEYFLIDGGVRKARIQRSKAQLMELEWDRERLIKDIDRRIKQSYNQITTNRLTLAATEDEIKANQELRRLNRQNLEIGDISILELIEVEERLFNSQATWHRISSEMLRNYYELLIGVGDLPAVLVHDYTSSRIDE